MRIETGQLACFTFANKSIKIRMKYVAILYLFESLTSYLTITDAVAKHVGYNKYMCENHIIPPTKH